MPATKKKNGLFGFMGKSKAKRLEESDPNFVVASNKAAAGKMARVSGGEVVSRGGKWGVVKANPKTKLELILDGVVAKKREITFDVRDYTEAQKKAIIAAAEKRGLHAASDGKHILVRDLRGMDGKKNPMSPAMQAALDRWSAAKTKLRAASELFEKKGGTENHTKWQAALKEEKSALAAYMKVLRSKKNNPENESEAMYKSFHGLPSEEAVEFEKDVHFHENLAALGELVELRVELRNGKSLNIGFDSPVENPRKKRKKVKNPAMSDVTLLCTNEEGTQLYVEGGDQEVDLKSFNLKDTEQNKESVVLGTLTHVTYHTTKVFDGEEETYDYIHKMGEKGGIPPTLLYDVANKALSISGGTYVINKPLLSTSPGIEH